MTAQNLKIILVVLGGIGTLFGMIGCAGVLTLLSVKPLWGIISALIVLPSTLISIGMLYFGMNIEDSLKNQPEKLVQLLMASMGLQVAE